MLPRGARFGRYVIDSLLGEGGMSLVYRAVEDGTGREIALKVLRPENIFEKNGSGYTDAVKRLIREGQAAMELRHPNIVSVFEVGEDDGMPFLAMELVDGQPLSIYLGDLRIPLSQRIRWLWEVASCLAHAHDHAIVHRDVKPENVLITKDGRARLTDFGIAKRIRDNGPNSGSFVTKIGMVVGTPMYMAPEQSIGEPADARSDQFSWATMAYELLAGGTHPVQTNNPRNLSFEFAILQERPRPLKEIANEVPDSVAAVIMKGLAKSPEDRNLDMNVVVGALEHHLMSHPVPKDRSSAQALPHEERRKIPIVEHGRPKGREPTLWFWFAMFVAAILAAVMAFQLPRALRGEKKGDSPSAQSPVGPPR